MKAGGKLIWRNWIPILNQLWSISFRKTLKSPSMEIEKSDLSLQDGYFDFCRFFVSCFRIFWSEIGQIWLKIQIQHARTFQSQASIKLLVQRFTPSLNHGEMICINNLFFIFLNKNFEKSTQQHCSELTIYVCNFQLR